MTFNYDKLVEAQRRAISKYGTSVYNTIPKLVKKVQTTNPNSNFDVCSILGNYSGLPICVMEYDNYLICGIIASYNETKSHNNKIQGLLASQQTESADEKRFWVIDIQDKTECESYGLCPASERLLNLWKK